MSGAAPVSGMSADVWSVISLLHDFAAGIDHRDWPLYRSVFADEFELDYSSYRAGNVGRWSADDWVARAQQVFPGLDATAHSLTNHRVSIDGDTATIRAYVRADHVVVDEGVTRLYTLGGWYEDDLVRVSNGEATSWRITHKRLHVRWNEGDPSIMDVARERVRNGISIPAR